MGGGDDGSTIGVTPGAGVFVQATFVSGVVVGERCAPKRRGPAVVQVRPSTQTTQQADIVKCTGWRQAGYFVLIKLKIAFVLG